MALLLLMVGAVAGTACIDEDDIRRIIAEELRRYIDERGGDHGVKMQQVTLDPGATTRNGPVLHLAARHGSYQMGSDELAIATSEFAKTAYWDAHEDTSPSKDILFKTLAITPDKDMPLGSLVNVSACTAEKITIKDANGTATDVTFGAGECALFHAETNLFNAAENGLKAGNATLTASGSAGKKGVILVVTIARHATFHTCKGQDGKDCIGCK